MSKRLIDLDTGEFRDFDEQEGFRYSTSESRKRVNSYYSAKRSNSLFRDYNKELGGFIFAVYEMSKEFSRHEDILSQADLTRLIFIATYTNFDGVLMENQKTAMSRKNLQSVTGLSRNKFGEFYSKCLKLGILKEHEGKILMNKDYAFKGGIISHKTGSESNYIRVYIDTIRELYKSTPIASHKVLGILFRVIPFLNIEYNLVCHNPAENIIDDVIPMTLGELAEKLGYSSDNVGRLKKELQSIKTSDGKQVICFATVGEDKRKYKIIVNPKVIYGGTNYEKIEILTALFR